MNILALDQARNGAWSVYEYETGKLLAYDSFEYSYTKYTYAQAVMNIEALVAELIDKYNISAVFIEDIQLRVNVQAFKKLAQLQGVLVNYFEKNDLLYGYIAPAQWQGFCKARGRSAKELKDKVKSLEYGDKKESKVLSIQFVKDRFGIETDNDNIADAICIGLYACNVININPTEKEET